jgi:hypothetical protein
MSRPNSVFVTGLQRFARLVAFANISSDRTVPFHTASLRRRNVYSLAAEGFDSRRRLREYPHVVASPDASKLMELHINATKPSSDNVCEAQIAVQEHEQAGSSWLESSLRVGVMTLLLPVWVLVAPAVTAVILRRKNASNVAQLQFPMPAAGQDVGDCDSAAVSVAVGEAVAATEASAADDDDDDVDASSCDIKSEILKGIGELPWFRVDVNLPGAHTHGRIVVRRPWIDSCGQDVVKFLVEVALLR